MRLADLSAYTPRLPHTLIHVLSGLIGLAIFVTAWGYYSWYVPPSMFPTQGLVSVPEGTTIADAAKLLESHHVVRSAFVLELVLKLQGRDVSIKAGDYYYSRPLTLTEVAQRLVVGDFGMEPIKITIPEGATTYEIARSIAPQFVRFDEATFLLLASTKEGYLFPDTYFFLPNATAQQVLAALEKNFYEKMSPLAGTIAASGKQVSDVVIMASLLEKEARKHEDRRAIAGVLYKRLDIGMPLQVDAVFGYINATSTFSPRYSDLAVDSPYNTYTYKGLPPGPIANPGLSSLEAALNPIPTDALYYLHGRDGTLHIALTYGEHVANKRRYLE